MEELLARELAYSLHMLQPHFSHLATEIKTAERAAVAFQLEGNRVHVLEAQLAQALLTTEEKAAFDRKIEKRLAANEKARASKGGLKRTGREPKRLLRPQAEIRALAAYSRIISARLKRLCTHIILKNNARGRIVANTRRVNAGRARFDLVQPSRIIVFEKKNGD